MVQGDRLCVQDFVLDSGSVKSKTHMPHATCKLRATVLPSPHPESSVISSIYSLGFCFHKTLVDKHLAPAVPGKGIIRMFPWLCPNATPIPVVCFLSSGIQETFLPSLHLQTDLEHGSSSAGHSSR